MIRHQLSQATASRVRAELWGLRKAIEREKLSGEWPVFISSRVYLRGPASGWIDPPLAPGEIAIVGADYLPWAQELEGDNK